MFEQSDNEDKSVGATITKVCSTCKRERPISEFHRNPDKKDGFAYSCKFCISGKKKKSYRQKNAKARHLNAVRENSTVLDISKIEIEVISTSDSVDEALLLKLLFEQYFGPNAKHDWSFNAA
jgi:hypothetical protein